MARRSSKEKKEVDHLMYCLNESEWARERARYSMVKRTTMVVSSPKRTREDTGSVWKVGRVDRVVRTALREPVSSVSASPSSGEVVRT